MDQDIPDSSMTKRQSASNAYRKYLTYPTPDIYFRI